MTNSVEPFDVIRARIKEGNAEARAAFLAVYEEKVDRIADVLIRGVKAFEELRRFLGDTHPRDKRLALAAFYFWSALHYLASATECLVAGHPVTAGSQCRLAGEAVAIALLLSHPDTGAFEQLERGEGIANKALVLLRRHAGKFEGLFLDKGAHRFMKMVKTFDDESHATQLATSHLVNLSRGGVPIIGGDYDPEKENAYIRLLNHIEGLGGDSSQLLSGFLESLRLDSM